MKSRLPSFVVLTDAPEINYLQDFVTLPRNYGSPAYFERADVKAIYATVFKNLDTLDSHTHFTEQVKTQPVVIKPNLVTVYSHMGFEKSEFPESTDPRVFDAVIAYLRQFTSAITIIESSGESMPTQLSFRMSGVDRIARHHGLACVALETQPVVRYMLPKAEVMKEVYLPKILQDVVNGRAFYVSVPKMKTNMYTGVTLGFKNAMGVLPYNLRQRNHTYDINKKLVDLLYLFRPNLTIIDGIIGGEGNTPAPVDPVDVRVIISGNNSVETDRVATRMMGIDPDTNKLMVEAVKKGFNDPSVTVIGTPRVVPFRKANNSLMDAEFRHDFPGVTTLVGHSFNTAPKVTDAQQVTPQMALQMEQACDGGCLPASKTSFEYMKYAANYDRNFELIILLGSGVEVDGQRYYFDAQGRPYDVEEIKQMPGRKLAVGECARAMRPFSEVYSEGCCCPPSCMKGVFAAAQRPVPVLTLKNRHLGELAVETLRLYFIRRRMIEQGIWADCPREMVNKIFPIPELDEQQAQCDFIEWPLPPMDDAMKKQLLADLKVF